MAKNEDLDYIKRFSKISIASVCRKLNINRANLINGVSTKDTVVSVKKEIENQIARLYIKEDDNK